MKRTMRFSCNFGRKLLLIIVNMKSSIKKISAEATYEIRKEVLRKGIDLPFTFKEDSFDTTLHLGAFVDEKLVGIVSLIASANPEFATEQYQLRGMATTVEVRGRGFGALLVAKACELLRAQGITVLWCNARKEATTFYKKLGFKVTGNEFTVQKVGPHYKMFIEL